jgi:hypothetical protein
VWIYLVFVAAEPEELLMEPEVKPMEKESVDSLKERE